MEENKLPPMVQQMVDLNKEIIQKQAVLYDYVKSLQEASNEEHYTLYRQAMENWIRGMDERGTDLAPAGEKEADIV